MSSAGTRVEQRAAKYQFGEFELLPGRGVLLLAGVRVPMMPKPFATLVVLVERAGETVSKDDLLSLVWSGTAVEENNLTQSISTLRKSLGEKRGENRFIATEPGNGYRFVAPVTRIEEAPSNGVETTAPPEAPGEIQASRFGRRTKWLIALAAAALVTLAPGIWLWKRPSAGTTTTGRRSVAVLRIRDFSKGSSETWLQTALQEMLTSELASGGELHAIPAEDVVRWRSDLGASSENARQADLIRLARRSFGAGAFVLGSYVVTGACPECKVRVDLGLFDAASGDNLATIIEEGPAQDLLDLTARLGAKLRASLGAGGTSAPALAWPAPSAMREYAEGLKALRRVDPMAARDHLEVAITADAGNPLIHSAQAEAWTALGYGVRANEESRRAYELSPSLSRLDQLGIEARYRASVQQWDQAIEIYRHVFQLFPDSLEDGLNLARAQFRGMKTADSISTLQLLRRLPKPEGNDPRIDLLEAQAAGSASDYARTRDLARRAANEAKLRGARYLFARARLLEGGAMQTLNDPAYYEVQTEGRKVCEELADRECVSMAWRIRGNERFSAGHFQEAQEAYTKGAGVARALGDRAELANLMDGLGVVAESSRQWSQAEQDFLEAVSLKEETGYNPSQVRIELAELYLRMSRFSDAADTADAAYAEAQKMNAREDLGEISLLRATMARLHGRLGAAQEQDERAIADLRVSKSAGALTLALAAVSSVLTARGDFENAEKRLAEARTNIPPAFTNPEAQGSIELAGAELLLAQGQYRQAAEEARRSAADFAGAHLDEKSAIALVTEADALEMLGRNAEALAASEEAERKAARTPDPGAAALARLARWRLSAGRGPFVPADLDAQVASLQNPELSLAEEFDRAMLSKRSGARDANRQLQSVADKAATQGYVALSRRARSLEQ